MTSAALEDPVPAEAREPGSRPSSHGPTADDGRWREQLAPYAEPSRVRTALDLLTGPVAYFAMWPVMIASLDVSYWLTLALAILGGGFLLRTFILFHDCTHGSLFRSASLNRWVGRILGVVVMHPFRNWRHSHAVHHGSAGDLERRGTGDVMTMTVSEYEQAEPGERRIYRLFRNPLIMFGIGPIWSLVIQPRIPPSEGQEAHRRSVWVTNVAVLLYVLAGCLLLGPGPYFLIQAPMIMVAGAAGVFLFFVQHQFEDVYWEHSEDWSYADAAIQGSSYLKLPQPLQFFTGNIGLHHVHHLNARIPNYNLQAAHDGAEVFDAVPVLTLGKALRCSRLKLIDDDTGALLTFREAELVTRAKQLASQA